MKYSDVQKAEEGINILLDSHRELLSVDEIESLKGTKVVLKKFYESAESEAQDNRIAPFLIDALALITRIALKVYFEE